MIKHFLSLSSFSQSELLSLIHRAQFFFQNQHRPEVIHHLLQNRIFALKITKDIDFVGATFVQFPLNNQFTSPRWFFDSNLFFTVNKHLEFTIHYDHNLDTYRPLPIDNYYYSISTGINIKF